LSSPPTGTHVLREYALLADGERGVLVGPAGDYAWMCFPRWHDDAVFCSLLGGRSTYTVTPRGRFTWGGYYEPGTLIWRSRWITEGGVVECREALALPADPGRALLLRRIEALDGPAHLAVHLDAGAGFDHYGMSRLARDDDGSWEGRLGEMAFRWSGAQDATEVDAGRASALAMEIDLDPGEHHDLVLALAADPAGAKEKRPPEKLWDETEEGWNRRVPDLGDLLGERDASHAYAVMSGLTSASGAMVAASTTSLPERAEEGRNYDYRYAWIRDQAYAGQAAAAAGGLPLMDDAVRFLSQRLLDDGPHLMPAYTIDGDPVPSETKIGLPGYPGGGDTLGNQVHSQFQLDAFGEALLLFAAASEHDHTDADTWRAAETAAEAIEARHHEADAGVWEISPDKWTHSRLVCAAGLRRAAAQAPGQETPAKWIALADRLVAEVSDTGLNRAGDWRRAPDDERTDAALLLAGIRGAVPAEDPRVAATLDRVLDELCDDGYTYRFHHGALPLGEAEGAFLLCGFWVALALEQQGRHTLARAWFERNRAACGPPGLLSEEFDVRQRELRGNLPQAFVHALLLECCATLQH
jgi:GH15 family glucan-1,4-alpha-glucosidase